MDMLDTLKFDVDTFSDGDAQGKKQKRHKVMDRPDKVFIDNALAQQDNIACLGIGKDFSTKNKYKRPVILLTLTKRQQSGKIRTFVCGA